MSFTVAMLLLAYSIADWTGAPRDIVWKIFVYGLAFAHYLLAFFYSKRQLQQVTSSPSTLMAFLFVIALGIALFATGFPLLVVFAIHHVFNEVFVLNRIVPKNDKKESSQFRCSSILLNLLLYFVLLRDTDLLKPLPIVWLFPALAAAYLLFGWCLLRIRPDMQPGDFIDACFFEILGLVLLGISFFHSFTLLDIVFYHVAFWLFYPLPKFWKQGHAEAFNYLGWNLGISAAMMIITPLSFNNLGLPLTFFTTQFLFWSYIHITTSMGLSTAHPKFITRWFRHRSTSAGV